MAKSNLQTLPDATALITRVKNNFQESILTTRNCMEDLAPIIAQAAAHMIQALLTDRKILVCGNGGSADRKSTRLNSSHSQISDAVLSLQKKVACERLTSWARTEHDADRQAPEILFP